MDGEPIIRNPLGWAQARLLGGGRQLLFLAGVYGLGVVMLMVLAYRLLRDVTTLPFFASSAQSVLYVVQAVVIFGVGTSSIKRAVQRDFTSDMISSHRLTAMTGHAAVLGYLTGPTSQALVATGVTWLICTLLDVFSVTRTPLLLGPAIVTAAEFSLAAMFWTLGVLWGLSTRGTVSALWLITILLITAMNRGTQILPGLDLLLSAVSYREISGMTTGLPGAWVVVAMVLQLVLAGLLFLAAARKYRRDDVPAFSLPLSCALVGYSALVGGLGLCHYPLPQAFAWTSPAFTGPVSLVCTMVAVLMAAMLPVATAARATAAWDRRRAREPGAARPGTYGRAALLSALIAALMLGAFVARDDGASRVPPFPSLWNPGVTVAPGVAPGQQFIPPGAVAPPGWLPAPLLEGLGTRDRAGLLVVSVACFVLPLLTFGGVMRVAYRGMEKGFWIMLLYVILAWALPPFAELSIEAMQEKPWEARSLLFVSSPIGAWIAAWTKLNAPLAGGIAVQAALAAAAMGLGRWRRWTPGRGNSQRAAAPMASPVERRPAGA